APAPVPAPAPQPQPGPKAQPNTNPPGTNPPKVEPKPNAPTPATGGQPRLASDFAALKPFVTRSALSVDPNDSSKKTARVVVHAGSGKLPAGWTARCWNKDTEMEVF